MHELRLNVMTLHVPITSFNSYHLWLFLYYLFSLSFLEDFKANPTVIPYYHLLPCPIPPPPNVLIFGSAQDLH